ncbi:hypothetical protein B0A48_09345 [Cryoendolithus antarcticus]|uniref:Phosphatidylglycerol/phosphatidylinositol transfer protein n=1 Tax=Cryoendolithus antarcticus TaxID=1507870 RepID=A0A1V8T2C2_9PEZI|nr:hypothetical protein B0A48_09345 [Cryoendolithus antarcticus]
MKLLSFSAALLASSITVNAKSVYRPNDVLIQDESLAVPGDNPLVHCANPKDDLLDIKTVNLNPNPPTAGTTLKVTAKGYLSEDVEEGAKVHLQVKYGLITIIKQDADLCEQVKNVDLECPVKKGTTELSKDIELPSQIPPGKYTVLADVVTKDGKKITCLTATVQFSRGGSGLVTGSWLKDL